MLCGEESFHQAETRRDQATGFVQRGSHTTQDNTHAK